eukprot:TRINITY_DN28958_c0_g7_i1.p1 TRINITY_DN28958_c0_g7~~TRINITY_DN28958_c0_g7_i1.p1  ORF type:complete len:1346 (-),score=292.55 TRINITY_DN28958_c0_g7_i1:642-4205(-)
MNENARCFVQVLRALDEDGQVEALTNLKVCDLKKHCELLGLSEAGRKAELIDRILHHTKTCPFQLDADSTAPSPTTNTCVVATQVDTTSIDRTGDLTELMQRNHDSSAPKSPHNAVVQQPTAGDQCLNAAYVPNVVVPVHVAGDAALADEAEEREEDEKEGGEEEIRETENTEDAADEGQEQCFENPRATLEDDVSGKTRQNEDDVEETRGQEEAGVDVVADLARGDNGTREHRLANISDDVQMDGQKLGGLNAGKADSVQPVGIDTHAGDGDIGEHVTQLDEARPTQEDSEDEQTGSSDQIMTAGLGAAMDVAEAHETHGDESLRESAMRLHCDLPPDVCLDNMEVVQAQSILQENRQLTEQKEVAAAVVKFEASAGVIARTSDEARIAEVRATSNVEGTVIETPATTSDVVGHTAHRGLAGTLEQPEVFIAAAGIFSQLVTPETVNASSVVSSATVSSNRRVDNEIEHVEQSMRPRTSRDVRDSDQAPSSDAVVDAPTHDDQQSEVPSDTSPIEHTKLQDCDVGKEVEEDREATLDMDCANDCAYEKADDSKGDSIAAGESIDLKETRETVVACGFVDMGQEEQAGEEEEAEEDDDDEKEDDADRGDKDTDAKECSRIVGCTRTLGETPLEAIGASANVDDMMEKGDEHVHEELTPEHRDEREASPASITATERTRTSFGPIDVSEAGNMLTEDGDGARSVQSPEQAGGETSEGHDEAAPKPPSAKRARISTEPNVGEVLVRASDEREAEQPATAIQDYGDGGVVHTDIETALVEDAADRFSSEKDASDHNDCNAAVETVVVEGACTTHIASVHAELEREEKNKEKKEDAGDIIGARTLVDPALESADGMHARGQENKRKELPPEQRDKSVASQASTMTVEETRSCSVDISATANTSREAGDGATSMQSLAEAEGESTAAHGDHATPNFNNAKRARTSMERDEGELQVNASDEKREPEQLSILTQDSNVEGEVAGHAKSKEVEDEEEEQEEEAVEQDDNDNEEQEQEQTEEETCDEKDIESNESSRAVACGRMLDEPSADLQVALADGDGMGERGDASVEEESVLDQDLHVRSLVSNVSTELTHTSLESIDASTSGHTVIEAGADANNRQVVAEGREESATWHHDEAAASFPDATRARTSVELETGDAQGGATDEKREPEQPASATQELSPPRAGTQRSGPCITQ